MTDDLVSIVIPTYNRAYCVGLTLDSVLAQTHPNWEVLLVDDGSTDNTRAFIQEKYGREPRIRYIYQQNAGVSHARNTGIRAAAGGFVAFLDSDDLWKPWKLEAQLACMHRFPGVGMVWTDMEAVDSDGKLTDPNHLRNMYTAYRDVDLDTLFSESVALASLTPAIPPTGAKAYAGDIYPVMIKGSLVHTSTVLMRRERLEKVEGFDEGLKISGEDYDFHLRTCKWGPVALLDIATIVYQRGRPDHLSRNSWATAANFLTTVQRAIADDATAKRFPPERVRQVLAEAHSWVAEERFKIEDKRGVRKHALQSLRRKPRQPRIVILLLSTLIPGVAVATMLSGYHAMKSKVRSGKK